MLLIQQITSDAVQGRKLILPDGSEIDLQMRFVSMQLGWFIDFLTYGDFSIQGLRITNSPNILYQFKNLIPFGLSCFSQGNREPTQQKDFSSGASNLYLLTKDEVKEYSDLLSGKV